MRTDPELIMILELYDIDSDLLTKGEHEDDNCKISSDENE